MGRLFRLMIVSGCAIFCCTAAAQPQSGTGSFDMVKVRSALAETTTTVQLAKVKDAQMDGSLEKVNYAGIIMRIAGYLLLIILIIMGIAWGVKKMGIAGATRSSNGSLDIVESLQIGQNRSIILVRLLDCVYLIGNTATNISVIEKIEGEKALELISATKGGSTIMQFKEVFNSFMGKNKKI